MDPTDLARLFYTQAKAFADSHNAPRTAIARAQFHSALQIFIDQDGADSVATWLESESKSFRETLDNYSAMFGPGGRC